MKQGYEYSVLGTEKQYRHVLAQLRAPGRGALRQDSLGEQSCLSCCSGLALPQRLMCRGDSGKGSGEPTGIA